jgi:hypothetical protein
MEDQIQEMDEELGPNLPHRHSGSILSLLNKLKYIMQPNQSGF